MINPIFALPRPQKQPNADSVIPTTVTVSSVTNPVTVSGTITVSTLGQTASFTTGQVTITASATPIFSISTSTIFREVVNPTTSTASIYLGPSGVTTTTGLEVPVATAFDMSFNSAAVYGIVATGSVTVSTIGW